MLGASVPGLSGLRFGGFGLGLRCLDFRVSCWGSGACINFRGRGF